MRVVADDKIPFLKGVLEPFLDVDYYPGKKIGKEEVKDADILIVRTRTQCSAELLEGSKVKFIGTATIGYDHIDTEYCERNNITWFNAPGCNSFSVQQYLMSALLYWAGQNNVNLKERTLGVIGVGNVGSKIVQFAEAIGMRVLLNDPPRSEKEGRCGFVSIDSIIQECDIITIHTPLLLNGKYKTYHSVDSKFIDSLKNRTLLINTSRGEVVDEKAVLDALKTNRLEGFIADVWENEPNINKELLNRVLLATPHIAGYSLDGKAKGTSMIVNKLSEYLDLPLNTWWPDEIPEPENKTLTIDVKGRDQQEVIQEVFLKSYNIKGDDALLRENPASFEYIRGNYRIRREPPVYNVLLKNNHYKLDEVFKNVRYNVEL